MPVGAMPEGGESADEAENNEELQKKLQTNFFKNNQTVHTKIAEAVAAGDMKLAHRLAHTLKGSAGLIGKTGLRNAASEVEALLREGTISVWENKMSNLKNELTIVLEELKQALDESETQEEPQTLNNEQILALFEKLKPMLENINPECVDMLGELRVIPEAEELVQQIENFNFSAASKTLIDLEEKMRKT
jgi:HPt (histidine-containing phosphotransfer) domain-containing protein